MLHAMNAKYLCLVTVALLALSACSSAPKEKSNNPLTPIPTELRHALPSDIGLVEIRAAVIDIAPRAYTLSIGTFYPYAGLFATETAFPSVASPNDLVAKLDHYVKEMPIGLVLTCEGELPGTENTPPDFAPSVTELQKALAERGIQHTLLIPLQWEIK